MEMWRQRDGDGRGKGEVAGRKEPRRRTPGRTCPPASRAALADAFLDTAPRDGMIRVRSRRSRGRRVWRNPDASRQPFPFGWDPPRSFNDRREAHAAEMIKFVGTRLDRVGRRVEAGPEREDTSACPANVSSVEGPETGWGETGRGACPDRRVIFSNSPASFADREPEKPQCHGVPGPSSGSGQCSFVEGSHSAVSSSVPIDQRGVLPAIEDPRLFLFSQIQGSYPLAAFVTRCGFSGSALAICQCAGHTRPQKVARMVTSRGS